MCYSYRDHETTQEARKLMRDGDERGRREEQAKKEEKKTAPEKERELVRA